MDFICLSVVTPQDRCFSRDNERQPHLPAFKPLQQLLPAPWAADQVTRNMRWPGAPVVP
jgi:hypothetical protein